MKKASLGLLIGGGIVLVLVMWCVSTYNGIVELEEPVTTAWANVQSQYQRRADLIPNLVNTVKGYAKHEQATLEGVISARARATQITVDPNNLTPEKLQEFQAAQGELSQALGRLMVVQEQYPDLKANEQFKDLQAQLEGTENRINKARDTFNATVEKYNLKVRRFPGNILASMFGFETKAKFEAEAGAQNAPTVSFE
ncbi:MAG: LemA family protein [Bacteroidaceae bacterium]|nr:LemA family protein [Bacteroidaceae bacterium]MBR7028276.1 LemA family protein [Bacteroidaceae bacterium]